MNARAGCPLIRAVLNLLPGGTVMGCKRQAWHSATFSGERVIFTLALEGADSGLRYENFSKELPEVEFTLRRQYVADILVTGRVKKADGLEVTVEALLLDE